MVEPSGGVAASWRLGLSCQSQPQTRLCLPPFGPRTLFLSMCRAPIQAPLGLDMPARSPDGLPELPQHRRHRGPKHVAVGRKAAALGERAPWGRRPAGEMSDLLPED